jgi:hypothetical protein
VPESSDQETTGRTVVGLFGRQDQADAAIRELKAAGFTDEQIGVAAQEESGEDGGVAVLVTVSAGARTKDALGILERYGRAPGLAG